MGHEAHVEAVDPRYPLVDGHVVAEAQFLQAQVGGAVHILRGNGRGGACHGGVVVVGVNLEALQIDTAIVAGVGRGL